jgi:hypothetical protein
MDRESEGFRLVSTDTLQARDNFAQAFLKGAFHGTIQSPINGAAQLTDRVLGTDILPRVQIMEPPDKSSMANEAAGILGNLAGTAVHVGGMLYLGGKLGGSELTRAGFRNRAIATGLLGAAYGGVFTPVGNDDGNFWATRAERTLVGGAALALMSPMHGLTSNMGLPKEAWTRPGMRDFVGKPMLFTTFGLVADCVAPSNWTKLQWWPDDDWAARQQEPAKENPIKSGTFVRRIRPVSELQR